MLFVCLSIFTQNCVNTCNYANDGQCDDGGLGSQYSYCNLGTDCNDCAPPPPPSIPSSWLLTNAPDTNQPQTDISLGISETNLCTPTAFSAQFRAFYNNGFINEIPTGVPYIPGNPYNHPGWLDFAYDGPLMPLYTNWGSVPINENPSFDWWFNTNNNGANDIPHPTSIGTSINNAIMGAEQCYQRTNMNGRYFAALHKNSSHVYGMQTFQPNLIQETWNALKFSIHSNKPVILFLDSYDISNTGQTTSIESVDVSLFNIGQFNPVDPSLEQKLHLR